MSRQWRILAVIVAVVTLFPGPLRAAAPARVFHYEKQTNLQPGAYSFIFSLYDSLAAETPLWTSGTTALTLKTPLLVYQLGGGTRKIPATIDYSQQLFVKVVKASPGPVVVVANRERLPIVPYALHSKSVTPGSIDTTSIQDGTVAAVDLADGAVLQEILEDGGSGSGIDADLLDGRDAAGFALEGHTHGFVSPGQADSVTSGMIVDGTILDADIGTAAAIADGKLARIETPGKVADSALSPNVDLLDASGTVTGLKTYHPAAGTVPFAVGPSKSGLVANLNADLLDGRHAGNASGDIPVSNGAVNANLRAESAERLDGLTVADLDARYGAVPAPAGMLQGYLRFASSETYHGGAVAIGADGLPLVVYRPYAYPTPSRTLRALRCADFLCSLKITSILTETTNGGPAVSIGVDGLPLVAYIEYPGVDGYDLNVIHCGNLSCSVDNALHTVDAEEYSSRPSLAIGTDGLPVIAYISGTDPTFALKVAHCSTLDCSSATTVSVVPECDSQPSLTVGADGLPVISFSAFSPDISPNPALKVVRCGNRDCSSGNTIATVDARAGEVIGESSSIAIGAGGLPVIVCSTAEPSPPRVVKSVLCGNPACSAGNSTTVVGERGETLAAAAFDADGLAFIVYPLPSPGNDLTLVKGFRRPFGR